MSLYMYMWARKQRAEDRWSHPHLLQWSRRNALLGWRLDAAHGRAAAELGDKPGDLEQRVEAVEHAHVAEADLLNELELEFLVEGLIFGDAEEGAHDVEAAKAAVPELLDDRVGLLVVGERRGLQALAHEQRMRLVAHLKHILGRDEAEARHGGLCVVERLTHIALGGEDERFETLLVERRLLRREHLVQPFEHLRVREL